MNRNTNEHKSENKPHKQAKESPPTRERILLLLKREGRMNANELSLAIGLTEMAIRRHMYELEKAGSVRIISVKQPMGRPYHAYELTLAADGLFPKNYDALTLDLLAELADNPDTSALIDVMFQGRKQKLLERFAARMHNKSLEDRVAELADIQNLGGYMTEVERTGDSSYILHEYNCPIAQVADKYEQACQCELALFQELLDVPVTRTECLAKGQNRCSYHIKQPS